MAQKKQKSRNTKEVKLFKKKQSKILKNNFPSYSDLYGNPKQWN